MDEHGVRAAQPQVMDQMIGGIEEPMDVDEYSYNPPVAEHNFSSAFGGGGAVGGVDAGPMNFGASASEAELERAI